MGCFSCFTSHDPSEDPFEAETNRALDISRIEAAEQIEIERVKEKSLKELAEQEEAKKGKRKQDDDDDQVEDKGQIKHSKGKDDVKPPPSICNGCKSEIEDGISINAFDALWHPDCFCCLHCNKPIPSHEISNKKGQYHKPCYKEQRHPNCYVCAKKIKGINYSEHPFWKEKYCPSHDIDETAKCCSCERLESFGTKYVLLADGRWLCVNCMECAVMDTVECQHLHVEIREFFESSLNLKIQKHFPLLLVEKEALNKAEEEEKIIGNQNGMVTRGICLSEEQIVTQVLRQRIGPNKQLIDMVKESKRVVRECEVTAILILYGLPRVLTGCILAHEMMHAYLRLNGYRNLNTVLEEGLCQVVGNMWLEPQKYATPDPAAAASSSRAPPLPPATTTSKKGDQTDFVKRLVEFCKHQIETDDSPVYGLGFQRVNKKMVSNNNNLKDTLKDIVNASKTYI